MARHRARVALLLAQLRAHIATDGAPNAPLRVRRVPHGVPAIAAILDDDASLRASAASASNSASASATTSPASSSATAAAASAAVRGLDARAIDVGGLELVVEVDEDALLLHAEPGLRVE